MNTPKNLHVIGLTGGIASGKSTVREILSGFPHVQVLDADKLGHLAYAPNTETLRKLVKAFGEQILTAEGTVNRAVLGTIVFNDKSKLQVLNEIVWPAIKTLALEEIQQCAINCKHVKVFILEAAVLVEAKWTDIVDEIWVVRTQKAKERLLKRNPSFSIRDVEARLLSQVETMEKRIGSAHVILENDGTADELIKKANDHLTQLDDRLCSKSGNGSELVDIVNPTLNSVVDVRKRAIVRAFNLPHRATYVVVFHQPTNKYIVQQRSATKEYAPLIFDPCPGGVVAAGETYEENAVREMEEEMGIKDVDFKFINDFWFESDTIRTWGRIFLCIVNQVFPNGFRLQQSEVDSIHLMTSDEILVKHRSRMTLDGLSAFENYKLATTSRL